jgi:Short C-terminal domain/Phospholipase_D-nuclease N-terminal
LKGNPVLAAFGSGQVLLSMIWFFLFVMWIMLVFRVVGDIFRSQDLSGGAKALWLILIVFFIYLGVFVYLVARGSGMADRELAAVRAQEDMMCSYIRENSGTALSAADELTRLAGLRDQGVIDDAEFQRLKAKIVG